MLFVPLLTLEVSSPWLRAHTLTSPRGLPGKSRGTSTTQHHGEMRGKGCWGRYGFFAHPPQPTRVLPVKLLKMVIHQQSDPEKNSCLIAITKMDI